MDDVLWIIGLSGLDILLALGDWTTTACFDVLAKSSAFQEKVIIDTPFGYPVVRI